MIVALVALFVALGGTAYAAATIGSGQIIDESIKSQDIKNGEVKNADLGTDAVGSGKISDGQVKAADIANGAVTSDKLATAAAASVMNSSTESVPTATGTTLHANTEFFDTANLHDSGTNTESFVAPVSGTYVVSAEVEWDASATGYRRTSIIGPNGAFASAAGPALASPAFTAQDVSGIEQLAAGESVHVEVLQGSGVSLGAKIIRFQIAFVGR
jgi:hypothetical protein